MRIKHMAVLLTLLASSAAMADPSPEIHWLMSDKLSMLDFGLIRMQAALQQELPDLYRSGALGSFNVADSYNPDDNQIKLAITAVYVAGDKPVDKDPIAACIRLVEATKKQLGTVATTGAEPATWVEYFHHAGWTTDKKEDTELVKALPSLLRITAVIAAGGESAKCSSMYLDKSIRVLQ
jgi:hypothetical protein